MNCSEDVESVDMMTVHQMSTSSILSPESVVCSARPAGGVGGGGAGALGSAELGRRLLLAARHGDTQLVLDLMAKGAPFTTDWLGTSALHAAALGAHAHTCAVLLRAGVSRDCRTKVDRTPLHMAAHAGHTDVAELLLQNHAAVDCRDMLHMTPLHWASARGHAGVAGVLLRRGADAHALSKFKKTPLALALENNHQHIVKLIEDALKDREAADSVESLRAANETEASVEMQRTVKPLDISEPTEPPQQTREQPPQPDPIKINLQRPLESRGEEASAAAAMLRRHGITLLPHDEGSTVLTALQSGRSVVLSDAGKLMLKESSEIPQAVQRAPLAASSKGVLLTATPVKAPPKQGVKIFTLNNKLLAMPNENKAPVRKVINPHDSAQVQYIKLPTDAKITTKSIPMKAKNKMSPIRAARPPASALARPAVKLMMQKNKLTENGMESSPPSSAEGAAGGGGGDTRSVLFVPEEFLTNSSPKYLRTQLLTAYKTIASLNAQLHNYKTRLANYETI